MKEFEDQIPEWKKGAVASTGDIASAPSRSAEAKEYLMKKIGDYFKKISEDDEEYEKMVEEFEKLKNSMKDMKGNVKLKVNTSDTTVIQKGIDLYDKAKSKIGSRTIDAIRKWDPEFDIIDFEFEAKHIFEEIYAKYLEHDVEYLEGVCASEGLGYFKSMIKMQEALGAEPKFKNFVFIKSFSMNNGFVYPETGLPVFEFLIDFSQIHCLVRSDDNDILVDGHDNNLEYLKFSFILAPSEDADVGKFFLLF